MRKRDYYDVLGVPQHASLQEIRGAYRRLARRYSPDINLWDERAAALFEEISEAYRILSDPRMRALFDQMGHRAFEPVSERHEPRPPRGDDLHCPIDIDLDEALRGVSAVVEVTRQERCATCHGTGGVDGRRPVPCSMCDARPVRVVLRREMPVVGRCESCGGTGWQVPEACVECSGRGTAPARSRIAVRVPPGVDTGSQIRMRGEGNAAPVPGEPGDLVVITRVRPHAFFTRKGDNLYCEVPVTVPEAALGARIRVPTPDGPTVITLPAGTQSGQVFRLRGRGCPRLGRDGHGDLFVAARVVIPKNADSTLEEVLRALERLLPANPRAELWSQAGGHE